MTVEISRALEGLAVRLKWLPIKHRFRGVLSKNTSKVAYATIAASPGGIAFRIYLKNIGGFVSQTSEEATRNKTRPATALATERGWKLPRVLLKNTEHPWVRNRTI